MGLLRLMTELEAARLCAKAMEVRLVDVSLNKPEHTLRLYGSISKSYWPFTDDLQTMDLIKKFNLDLMKTEGKWRVLYQFMGRDVSEATDDNLNNAVVNCVAKAEETKDN